MCTIILWQFTVLQDGKTPLDVALKSGFASVAELLQRRADTDLGMELDTEGDMITDDVKVCVGEENTCIKTKAPVGYHLPRLALEPRVMEVGRPKVYVNDKLYSDVRNEVIFSVAAGRLLRHYSGAGGSRWRGQDDPGCAAFTRRV